MCIYICHVYKYTYVSMYRNSFIHMNHTPMLHHLEKSTNYHLFSVAQILL